MGAGQSKTIDSLGHVGPFPPPQAASRVKLEQLLLAISSNYRFNSLGETLVAAYYCGLAPQELTRIFDQEAESLPTWPEDDPVADSVWDDTLNDYTNQDQYQRRYFDFFRDQLTETPDWKSIAKHYTDRLFEGFWQYDMRGLIELAMAISLDEGMVGMEALAMAAWAGGTCHYKRTLGDVAEELPLPSQPIKSTDRDDVYLAKALTAALRVGGVALRGAAAACEVALGKHALMDKPKVVERLVREMQVRYAAAKRPEQPAVLNGYAEERAAAIVKLVLADLEDLQ